MKLTSVHYIKWIKLCSNGYLPVIVLSLTCIAVGVPKDISESRKYFNCINDRNQQY